jgi:hypothetical protein
MFKISAMKHLFSIESIEPETPGKVSIEGIAPILAATWIESLYGMYGHGLDSKMERPIDLFMGISQSGLDYEIIEGHEILDLPLEEIPEGSRS